MATVSETTAVAGVTARSELGYDLKIDYMEMQDAWLHSPEQTIPNRIAQKRGKLAGLKSQFMAPTSPPTGVGARLEKWRLPTHRSAAGANPEILARGFKLRTRITTEADLATKAKGTQGAFAAAKSLEQQMIRDQFARQWVDNLVRGNFHVLGVVSVGATNASAAGTSADYVTITLQGRNARRSTAGLTFATGTSESVPFVVGMPISLIRAAAGVGGSPANTQSLGTAGEAYIVSIDFSDIDNPTLTIAPPAGASINTTFSVAGTGIAAGDFIVPYASRRDIINGGSAGGAPGGATSDAISDYAGMNGLMQCQTGTTPHTAYLGLAKSSYSGLRANHSQGSPAGSQRDWTRILGGTVIRNSWERAGKMPNQGICAPEMFDEIYKETIGGQRFGEVVGNVGFSDLKISMHGVTMGFDMDFLMSPGCIDMVNDQFFGYFETCPLMSPDPVSERYVPDYDQLETVLVKIGNTACTRPFAGGRVDDLNYNHG